MGVFKRMLFGSAWQEEVLRQAGLDPQTCPVCGPRGMEFGWNMAVLCCRCFASPYPTVRAELVLKAASAAGAQIYSPARGENWEEPILQVVDGQNNLVAEYRKGRHHPVWTFYGEPEGEDGGSTPEGLKVVYPEWWPVATLAEFDKQEVAAMEAEWEATLVEIVAMGKSDAVCHKCGRNSYCATVSWKKAPECDGQHYSFGLRLQFLKDSLESFKRAEARESAEKQKAQEKVDEIERSLSSQGFFRGRRKWDTPRPAGSEVLFSSSDGSKKEPNQTIIAVKLTFDQLVAVVESRGDYSWVEQKEGIILLHTQYPRTWIGKGGCVVKTLSKAVGCFIKVIEEK